MINHQYPYTNFHDLNLDWILEEIKQLSGLPGLTREQLDKLLALADALPIPTGEDFGKFVRADRNGRYYLMNLTNVANEGA